MANYDASSRYKLDTTGQLAFRTPVAVDNYVLYTVRQGDSMETIASKYYGNMKRYWEIADANPQVQFPLDLTVGMVLRIPV